MPKLKEDELREFLTNPAAHVSCIMAVLLDRFGERSPELPSEPALLSWEPETIARELHDEFGIALADVDTGLMGRIATGINLLKSDDFFSRVVLFGPMCKILDGEHHDPDSMWSPPTGENMAWGVTEAGLLHPLDQGQQYSEEVRVYVGRLLQHEGVCIAPATLAPLLGAENHKPLSPENPWLQRTVEVDQHVREMMSALFAQLASLPLRHGDGADLATRLLEDRHGR